MKRPILITLVAIVLVAACVGGFFLAQPNSMAPRVKQLELDLSKAQNEAARVKAEYDKLLAAKKPDPTIAHTDTPPTQPLASTPKAGQANPADALSKLVEDPRLRDAQKVQVEMTYNKLFQQLGLNDKELENFKHLLADRGAKVNGISMKMMDPNLTPQQRLALEKQVTAARNESDAAIHQFLNNDDDFKTYQKWDDTQAEIMELNLFAPSFAAANAPLSDQQRDQLIDLMASVRKAPGQTANLNDPRNITSGSLTPDGVALQLGRMDADDERVLQQAAGFLSPEQLDALKKVQAQNRSLTAAGMRVVGSMFGAPKK